ncbi:MAG: hypothetical protein HY934_10120 [Candidatus Firestonebacteria bacterium]|nr:hypothetical protein [Candidatus Firestonebacteria bacterium]
MPIKDLHKKPFSDETITKLEIFESYLKLWLPVFIQSQYFSEAVICDFFAGKGYDSNGIPGSPLRILNIIMKIFKRYLIKKNLN